MPKLALVTSSEWYFCSHRLPVARAARDAGYEVLVVAGEERGMSGRIVAEGFTFVSLPISRGSTAVDTELRTLRALHDVYRHHRPDLVHHIALKPVVYGTMAARAAGVPAVVNAIAGQGYLAAARDRRAGLLRLGLNLLLRTALRYPRSRTIFQNPDDLADFVGRGIVRADQAVLIRGSGVDLDAYRPSPPPAGPPMILFASRLLWSKGIRELVEATRRLGEEGSSPRLVIVGIPDANSPDAVPESQLRAWVEEGILEWWGLRGDMPAVLAQSSIVCLPSVYGEGIPKVLLEAAAAGRPIVTTDMPGCREIVVDGHNGLLTPPGDVDALARALSRLLADPQARKEMGAAGRALAEQQFGDGRVAAETLGVYQQLLDR